MPKSEKLPLPPHAVSAAVHTFNVGAQVGAYYLDAVPAWFPLPILIILVFTGAFFAVTGWMKVILYFRGSVKDAAL